MLGKVLAIKTESVIFVETIIRIKSDTLQLLSKCFLRFKLTSVETLRITKKIVKQQQLSGRITLST